MRRKRRITSACEGETGGQDHWRDLSQRTTIVMVMSQIKRAFVNLQLLRAQRNQAEPLGSRTSSPARSAPLNRSPKTPCKAKRAMTRAPPSSLHRHQSATKLKRLPSPMAAVEGAFDMVHPKSRWPQTPAQLAALSTSASVRRVSDRLRKRRSSV